MIVLRAIGSFFVKIGRWIKNTAWVQPLLIVGGIFAIIFSIPYITKWVQSWFAGDSKADTFYSAYKKSLDGAKTKSSDADKLFDYMINFDTYKAQNSPKVKEYGEKFFLVFTEEGCEGCKEAYKGFETLRDSWNKNSEFTLDPSKPHQEICDFKIHTIFTDTYDKDDDTVNLFQRYFFGTNYDTYFADVVSDIQDSSYYYLNNGGNDSNYAKELETLLSEDTFKVPTIFMVDFNYELANNQLGVSEVLFSVNGKNGDTSAIGKARFLFDCWTYQDIFSKDYHTDK